MPNYIGAEASPIIARTNWRIVERVWNDPAHATANINDLKLIEDPPPAAKGTPHAFADSITVERGYVVNSQTFAVQPRPPVDNSTPVQQTEIDTIIHQRFYEFNRWLFEHANSASRPIYATIAKRTLYLCLAAHHNTSDTALDKIKTEAQVDLDDFAYYADMSAWANAFDGGSFHPFTITGVNEESVGLSANDTGITAPTTTQISAATLTSRLK